MVQRMPRRAVVYTRISRDRNDSQLGVARQERLCRTLCGHAGFDVAQVLVDNDVSATGHKARPGFEELLHAVTAGGVDVIVALDSDRLLRKPGDLERLFELCEEHQVRVVYEHGGFDPVSGDGMMEARIRAAVDAEEVAKLRKRVRRKALELAELGEVSGGGWRPFGFEDDRRTVRDTEAVLIREAAHRVLAGDGIRAVCRDWNARGVLPVRGGVWTAPAMRRMLVSGRIAGWREHNGELVARAVWPAIVDEAIWRQVRAILTDPARRLSPGNARKHLLSGFLVCGRCGRKLVARPDARRVGVAGGVLRYVCTKPEGCARVTVMGDHLEGEVIGRALYLLQSPAVVEALAARNVDDRTPGLLAAVEQLEARRAQLGDDYAAELVSRGQFLAAAQALDGRLDAARRHLSAGQRQHVLDDIEPPDAAAFAALGLERRRAILAALIETITIAPAEHGSRFDPARVTIAWRA